MKKPSTETLRVSAFLNGKARQSLDYSEEVGDVTNALRAPDPPDPRREGPRLPPCLLRPPALGFPLLQVHPETERWDEHQDMDVRAHIGETAVREDHGVGDQPCSHSGL